MRVRPGTLLCTSKVVAALLSVRAGRQEGTSVMIEAQEAATEGAHVAVPEGLVPAMETVTVAIT